MYIIGEGGGRSWYAGLANATLTDINIHIYEYIHTYIFIYVYTL